MKSIIRALTVLVLLGTIVIVPGSEPVGAETQPVATCTGFSDWDEADPGWFDDHHHMHESGTHPSPDGEWFWKRDVRANGPPHTQLFDRYTLDDEHHEACE